jgi:hypothetical protein
MVTNKVSSPVLFFDMETYAIYWSVDFELTIHRYILEAKTL